jgi:DNA-binding transcriptional MerR regulator
VRNRRALYTDRHVDQVMAIKRLQAAGHNLSAIQGLLAGLSPAHLHEVAEGRRPKGGRQATEQFWSRPPTAPTASMAEPDTSRAVAKVMSGVSLSDSVTLSFPMPARPLDDEDTSALAAAARPLLDELARRGLLDPAPKGP